MGKTKRQVTGSGKPIVCVPIIEQKKDAIVKEVSQLIAKQVEMIEWRIDWFADAQDISEVKAVLVEIKEQLEATEREVILLATFRTKQQGGQWQPEPEWLRGLYQMLAASGLVDFIDVEYYEWDDASALIHQLQKSGTAVITSHHNFVQTPPRAEMEAMLTAMAGAGADIVKLAVMPQEKEDVLQLLGATSDFKKKNEVPVVTMSMGTDGMISRICGEIFGSCITFGSHQNPSAPGQLQMEKLETMLTYLHQSIVK